MEIEITFLAIVKYSLIIGLPVYVKECVFQYRRKLVQLFNRYIVCRRIMTIQIGAKIQITSAIYFINSEITESLHFRLFNEW